MTEADSKREIDRLKLALKDRIELFTESAAAFTILDQAKKLTVANAKVEKLEQTNWQKDLEAANAEIERLKVALRSANRLIEPGAETQTLTDTEAK